MNLIHNTKYYLYNDNINVSMVIISDIHFNKYINMKRINTLINKLKEIKPKYILIPGDIINSVDVIPEIETKLIKFLINLASISCVLIGIGNHDFSSKKHDYYSSKKLFKKINNITNVYVLDNNSYTDDLVYITGITIPSSYYEDMPNADTLVDTLNKNKKLLTNLDSNKIKLCLLHSPESLNDKKVNNILKEYDYFISGHMHRGCIPPLLDDIIPGSRGIIGPKKNMFPQNERNTLKLKSDKIIVNGAVNTFSGNLRFLNIIYPVYLTTIVFTSNSSYNKEKVVIKKSYEKR